MALECGGSDGFAGLAANPALGRAVNLPVKNGGTAIRSETTEIFGVEHTLTRRLFDKMDWDMMCPSCITGTVLRTAGIPLVLESDRQAIQVCLKACVGIDRENPRIVRIPNSCTSSVSCSRRPATAKPRPEVNWKSRAGRKNASINLVILQT